MKWDYIWEHGYEDANKLLQFAAEASPEEPLRVRGHALFWANPLQNPVKEPWLSLQAIILCVAL